MYRAPTPPERERWHAVWLLTLGWAAAAVGRALARDAHTIGQWARAFAEGGPKGLVFEQTGGSPRVGRGATRRTEVGGAAIAVAGRHQAIQLELEGGASVCGRPLRVSAEPEHSCLNYLHRLRFVLKRPRKRLLKADPARREVFVGEYAALTVAAARTGTKIFFADEAHFQADADLQGKWVLKGKPALVGSTSPRRGEKVSYYSAVCRETGEVEVMELEGNSNVGTSTAFLLGLGTPGINLQPVLGNPSRSQGDGGQPFTNLTQRHEAVKSRSRILVQAKAVELIGDVPANPLCPANVDLTFASVQDATGS